MLGTVMHFSQIRDDYEQDIADYEALVQAQYDRSFDLHGQPGLEDEPEIQIVRKMDVSLARRILGYLKEAAGSSMYCREAIACLEDSIRVGKKALQEALLRKRGSQFRVRLIIPEGAFRWLQGEKQGLLEWLQGSYTREINWLLD